MNIYDIRSMGETIKGNEYVGRGIVIGLTEDAKKPVVPGEINEYNVEVMSVCHMFKAGHRICVEISCLDLPDGACCVCDTEYIPYHICRNATVCHKIYRDGAHPSHILLPVIPQEA